MAPNHILIIGAGAAGVFAAANAAENNPSATITLLEKSPSPLAKVRISGGGRCNVTHACFDPRSLSDRYPRGGKALISPFHLFQPQHTIQWFESHGVPLKTEKDGRIFPSSDSSQSIIDALLLSCRKNHVQLLTQKEVTRITPQPDSTFKINLASGESNSCSQLLVATGGLQNTRLQEMISQLGHTIHPPVPSLFTFNIPAPWIQALAGVSIPQAQVSIPQTKLKETGPLLLTHWGLSGPAILKLSAWGARQLHQLHYQFELLVDWLPSLPTEQLTHEIQQRRNLYPAKSIANLPIQPIPQRLWTQLLQQSQIPHSTRWSELSKTRLHTLLQTLKHTRLKTAGKSTNKDEFVTCGGVALNEIDFKTMQSKIHENLHFAGEILDIDGITGGFNFQAAWTTARLAALHMTSTPKPSNSN
jgi:predicted Rossmann fold flavoprotein